MPASFWAAIKDGKVVSGSQFWAAINGQTHILVSACSAASSARLLPLAIRELLFWCEAHLIIADTPDR